MLASSSLYSLPSRYRQQITLRPLLSAWPIVSTSECPGKRLSISQGDSAPHLTQHPRVDSRHVLPLAIASRTTTPYPPLRRQEEGPCFGSHSRFNGNRHHPGMSPWLSFHLLRICGKAGSRCEENGRLESVLLARGVSLMSNEECPT